LLTRLAGSGLGLGLIPVAPGTFGTLAGVALAVALPGDAALAAAAAFLLVAGVPLASAADRPHAGRDPPLFVLDEVAGYLLCVIGLPRAWWCLAVAFVAFRVFDIAKPWPVRAAERLPGGLGVMADDVVAAAFAHVVLRLAILLV
jgi:phosphatidylglycerophosphatase A